MNTTLNIGLAGLGTVGGGLVRLLSENAEEIRARSGCDFIWYDKDGISDVR